MTHWTSVLSCWTRCRHHHHDHNPFYNKLQFSAIQWNLSSETTAMRDHLSWRTRHILLAEGPTIQCNWTCHHMHQRPHVLRDHICMANGPVFQGRFNCTCKTKSTAHKFPQEILLQEQWKIFTGVLLHLFFLLFSFSEEKAHEYLSIVRTMENIGTDWALPSFPDLLVFCMNFAWD